MPEPPTDALPRLRLDRRTVMRAGVWSVPVVSLATAAPVMAASTPVKGSLRFNFFNVYGAAYNTAGHATTAHSGLSVQNEYVANGPVLSTVTVTVSYADTKVTGAVPTVVTGSGWSYVSKTHASGKWTYTFLYTGAVASGGSTSQLEFEVKLKTVPAGSMTLSAAAVGTNVTAAAASATGTMG